jgi:hypothetical protein
VGLTSGDKALPKLGVKLYQKFFEKVSINEKLVEEKFCNERKGVLLSS